MKRSFSVFVSALQKTSGIAQAALARALKMQPTHLNAYLRGRTDIHSELLVRLLRELGIDLTALIQERIQDGLNQEKLNLKPIQALEILLRQLDAGDRRAILRFLEKVCRESLGPDSEPLLKLVRRIK